ncbi:hypothetical protein [Marinicellulosiphila megalodicopiae]|uniref:hypothetical protein n=1 Tax=Marinicellulosiphila megalodicopiae TaxID=2724896 RepID=UPI003BAF1808
MSKYDEEYYVFERPIDDAIPSLIPDENTRDRQYTIKKVEGLAPLNFTNRMKKNNLTNNLDEKISEILFDAGNFLITDNIYKKINLKNLPLDYTSAIYVDNNEKWHEEYWYVRVTQRIDCWCRDRSRYLKKMIEATGAFHVFRYVLDEKVLDKIEEKDRLIFKMDKSAMGNIIVHKSFMEEYLLTENTKENFTLISQYRG